MAKTLFPGQRVQVCFLVGDLRSHMPCGAAKKKKNCFDYGNRKPKTGESFIKEGVLNMSNVAEKSKNRG